MVWYPILGYSTFWAGLIAAIIIFSIKRRWYPIMYLISIATYIFTIGFMIDVFNFTADGILITLAVSTFVMLGAGYYISKKFKK